MDDPVIRVLKTTNSCNNKTTEVIYQFVSSAVPRIGENIRTAHHMLEVMEIEWRVYGGAPHIDLICVSKQQFPIGEQ
jgi:hypothetical protein